MSDDHERRLSVVEANVEHFNESVNKIEGYIGRLFDQNGEIKTSLALVVQNQNLMNDYRKRCDEERARNDRRITVLEGFQGRLIKLSFCLSGVIAFFITSWIEWEKK